MQSAMLFLVLLILLHVRESQKEISSQHIFIRTNRFAPYLLS
jgi:hypothetical protein